MDEFSTPADNLLTVSDVSWDEAGDELFALRCEVFVDEQKVPLEEELDDDDPPSRHVLARLGEEVVGCGRLTPSGAIGRMAVKRSVRGRGVGRAIIERLLAIAAEEGRRSLVLSAQVHALDFYARFGFVAEGPVYDEVDIPHRKMRREL